MKWMMRTVWFGLSMAIAGPLLAQTFLGPQHYERLADSLILDSLRAACGQHKQIPSAVELQALRALSHYPELSAVSIEFIYCEQKTAHSSQPKLKTMLRKASRRTYQVRISTKVPSYFIAGMHANLPYEAQVGVLGHELGHTLAYLKRGFGGLLIDGLRYGSSKRYVIRTEHATDQRAIDHGLGRQLLTWAQIAHPLLVKAGRGQNYMLPEEIAAQLPKP